MFDFGMVKPSTDTNEVCVISGIWHQDTAAHHVCHKGDSLISPDVLLHMLGIKDNKSRIFISLFLFLLTSVLLISIIISDFSSRSAVVGIIWTLQWFIVVNLAKANAATYALFTTWEPQLYSQTDFRKHQSLTKNLCQDVATQCHATVLPSSYADVDKTIILDAKIGKSILLLLRTFPQALYMYYFFKLICLHKNVINMTLNTYVNKKYRPESSQKPTNTTPFFS